jgi:chromosome segregation ATPase
MRPSHTKSYEINKGNEKNSLIDNEVECLQQELEYLRSELDKLNRQHSKTVIDLKQYQEHQLSKILSEKEALLQADFNSILSLQKVLSSESDESSKLRQKILSLKLEHSEKFSEITSDLEKLVKEADFLRNESLKACKSEVSDYQNMIESKRLDYSRKMREIENVKSAELFEIENLLDHDERKIRELEIELKDVRDKVIHRSQFDEGEIGKIHATLRSTQRILEQQEKDLSVLRSEREKARIAARDAEKNLAIVKHRVDLLKGENDELKAQLKRLERLTYGK